MKKVSAIFLTIIVIMTQAFSLTTSAATVAATSDAPVVKTGSDFWINDWNADRARSIVSSRHGLLKTDYYYNCFTRYRSIKMVDSATYYSEVTEPYFKLKNKVDFTPYLTKGTMRFWVDVPKNMSLMITLISVDRNGSFGRCRVTVDLKTEDEIENYQKVCLPLSSFTAETATQTSKWDPTMVRYIAVGGISSCTAETFLADGEIINISDIEVWEGEAAEPEPFDATPHYYSKNGDYYIRDLNNTLDVTSQVSGFKNSLEKDNYTDDVELYSNYVSLLEVYTVNVIGVGTDYRVSVINDYVEVYIPLSKDIRGEELLVGTVINGTMVIFDHDVTEDYLIVTANSLGDILVMDNVIPKFTAYSEYYEQSETQVYDNWKFESAVFVKTDVDTSKFTTVYNHSGTDLPPLLSVTDWLHSQDGVMRFWIKTPWKENTPKLNLKIDLCVLYYKDGNGAYPQTSAEITVPFDGLWHEVRISADSFNRTVFDSILADDTLASTYSRFYLRVKSGEAKANIGAGEGLYLSDVEFFEVPLNTETDSGNIERESFVLTGKKQDYVTDVTTTTVTVSDNDYVTTAKRITRKETTSDFAGKILLPYSANISVPEGKTLNQLGSWFSVKGAEMRTFLKNESDSPISFKIGIYGKVTYSSSTVYPKVLTNYITLEPDSGWQEIRFTVDDTDATQTNMTRFITTSGYVALEIYTKKNEFLQSTGDSMLVAPLEIYSLDIVEDKAVDFSKKYKSAAIMSESFSGSADTEDFIEKTYSTESEIPFIKKGITLTATDSYSFKTVNGKPIGILRAEPVFARDFYDWATNGDAQMRFWIKSDVKRSFILSLSAGGEEIKSTVNVEESDNWQQIVLKRSDFSANTGFDSKFSFADTRNVYLNIYALSDTFAENQGFTISARAEFYSGAVYQKGDTNMDEGVDLKDLVRIKKLSAADSDVFIGGDLDSDDRLTATDISILRNRIVGGVW